MWPSAGADRDRLATRARGRAADRARRLVVADVVRVPVAELSVCVYPQQRTRPLSRIAQVKLPPTVIATAFRPEPEFDRPGRAGGLVVADRVRVPVAELSFGAAAPAAHRAVVEYRTGVVHSGADCDCLAAGAEIDRTRRARRFVIADRVRVPVAELTARPAAPAVQLPGAHHCTRVREAGVQKPGRQPSEARGGLLRARARDESQRSQRDEKAAPTISSPARP